MDLRIFLDQLEAQQALKRIAVSVDPRLEVAALCRRQFATSGGGQVLLFENVLGADLPLVANLFGSEQRTAQMLRSSSLEDFSQKLSAFFGKKSGSARDRLRTPSQPQQETRNKLTRRQIFTVADTSLLPAICSWPAEQKPYLTLALLITEHPETGQRNLGLYRAQIIANNRIAINFSTGSGAFDHLKAAEKMQQPLPASLVLGGDPALIWAAAAPLPSGCDEFSFCQELFQADYQFIDCQSQPLSVPADAEIVIEGQIAPGDIILEGPFGNHTGKYASRKDCPVMQVTAISHREQPVMPITVVGPPPSENVNLAKANRVLICAMLKIDFPQIRDLQMPLETIFHGVSLLSVAPQSTAANKELIYNLWQQSPLSKAKLLILLDADIELSAFSQSWWRTINQLEGKKIYQDANRLAIDATGVDPIALVRALDNTI